MSPNSGSKFHRIGINAQLLAGEAGYRRAGIHQYIAQTLRHLPDGGQLTADKHSRLDYHIYTQHSAKWLQRPDFSLHQTRWPTARRSARIVWEQTAWPVLGRAHKLDLMHSMAFVTPAVALCPAVVTVYDLSFIHYPENFPAMQRRYLTSQTARSCQSARRVITISESSRQDVHRFFDVPLEMIDVVTPGVDPAFHPLAPQAVEQFRQQNELPAQFLLHVGTLQPRKNIPILLEALAKLKRPDLLMVLAGGKGWLYDEIFAEVHALKLEKQVRFTGYVPDELLPYWYNAATLLVFPSLYEGFGMPIIEAMACGTPVVASNVSSMPQAGGTAATYFPPEDVDALVDCLVSVLDDPTIATAMRQNGLQQAAHFSWEQAGRETAVVYQRALSTS